MGKAPQTALAKPGADHRAGPAARDSRASRCRIRQRFSALALRLLAALTFAGTASVPIGLRAQDIERGRQLYENHCQGCHTSQVHGREKRIAFSVSDLREIVDRWQRNQKLNWSAQEIEDVVQYLGTTRYFFIGRAREEQPGTR